MPGYKVKLGKVPLFEDKATGRQKIGKPERKPRSASEAIAMRRSKRIRVMRKITP